MTGAAGSSHGERRGNVRTAVRPPAPEPGAGGLGPLGLYRALRANSITAWRAEAYEEPYIADRNMLGGYVPLNDPDLIRRVLVDNAANYLKDNLQLEKLTPAVGRGLLTAQRESWWLQRRTVAPFSAERFAPERRAQIPRFAYLPFGAGARICVGAAFAMQEMLLALALIARRFRVTLADDAQVMPLARMTLRPMNGLPMRIERRI